MDNEALADLVDREIAHCNLAPEARELIRRTVRSGDVEAMRRISVGRQFAMLADGRGLQDARPVYQLVVFPQKAAASGPGAKVATLVEIAREIEEREALFETYGREAVEAASPPSRARVI